MGNYWLDRILLDETKADLEAYIMDMLRGAVFDDPAVVAARIRDYYIDFFKTQVPVAHLFGRYEIKFVLEKNAIGKFWCKEIVAEAK